MTSFVLIDRTSNQNQQTSGEACAALTIYCLETGQEPVGVYSSLHRPCMQCPQSVSHPLVLLIIPHPDRCSETVRVVRGTCGTCAGAARGAGSVRGLRVIAEKKVSPLYRKR